MWLCVVSWACAGWSEGVKQSGILGVSAVKGLQGCGYVCNGYQW